MSYTIDMTYVCPSCGTDVREGRHREFAVSASARQITVTCTVPRESTLPRVVVFVFGGEDQPEWWYRGRSES